MQQVEHYKLCKSSCAKRDYKHDFRSGRIYFRIRSGRTAGSTKGGTGESSESVLGAPYKTPYTIPQSTVAFNFTKEVHEEVQKWPQCYGVWETVREFIQEEDENTLGAIEKHLRIVFRYSDARQWQEGMI